jgi:integrase-like protein
MVALGAGRRAQYALPSEHTLGARLLVREPGSPETPKPRLLDRVRQAIGARHYSGRTEKAYVHWIKRYVFFHGKRHPADMGAAEVTKFLTSLAVHSKVAASTQNQALSALLFLYREVLEVELPWLDAVVRPPGRQHHDDLHSRSQSGPGWRPEPGRPNVPVMGFSLQQRYQISERDIRQRLVVYHGTRGRAAYARGREFRRPVAVSGSLAVIYRTTQSDNAVQDTERSAAGDTRG